MRFTKLFTLALAALALTSQAVCAETKLTRDTPNRKLTVNEFKRKQIVEKMDKLNLRDTGKAISFKDDAVLKVPAEAGDITGASVAKTAPKIDFGIIPLDARYHFERPDGTGGGLWCIWGQGSYQNGKAYGSIGNHEFFDSRIHVVEYDPKSMKFKVSPELNTLCGNPIEYGDGKIHGDVDFYGDDMYFFSYWTEYPAPKEEKYQLGYQGSHLMSYNFKNGKFRDFGIPLKRVSYPYHRLDPKRGLLYGVGSTGEDGILMVWDVKKQKMLYGGFPPNGMSWYSRALIIDEETGCVYTSNNSRQDPDKHILKYDPSKNIFSLMNSAVVKTPGSKANEADCMRAHTTDKLPDGSFICMTRAGRMFKFFPAEDKVEDLGFCWQAESEKLYTASIAMSPDGKYIYYVPGAHGGTHKLGGPVVQYNTITKERKALAFLFPYIYEKYGYITGGTFSMNIDEKGETLYIYMNGAFSEYKEGGGDVFGDPSVIVVHIPESERK